MFGSSILDIGDINKDGYNDFAIGAPATNSQNLGAVYIYYGGPNFNGKPALEYTGQSLDDSFGYSMATITIQGNIQLLISATQYNTDVGRVYLTLDKSLLSGTTPTSQKPTPGYTTDILAITLSIIFLKKRKINKNK